MKKYLLSLATAAFISGVMTQPVNAAGIQETPLGTVYNNIYRSSKQYLYMWGALYESDIEGKISNLVIDGKDFYMYMPVSTFATTSPYWIKGTLSDNGDEVVFSFPQDVYIQPANPYSGAPESQISAQIMKVITVDDTNDFVVDTENRDLVMKWKDNRLSQIDTESDGTPRVIGLVDADGMFTGSAEGNIDWLIFDENLPTPPAGMETTQYICSAESNWGEKLNRIVEIGVADNRMWIKGLYSYFSDSWITGTIDGDKVTLPTDQYLGIYTTEMYYYFFQAAGTEEYENEWGEPDVRFIPEIEVTLTKTGDKYIADKAMLMTFGMKTANPGMPAGSRLMNVTFSPYEEKPATPANPSLNFVGDYYAPYGRSVSFTIPATDTEGNFINPDNMYYNIFINNELFSFTPEVYPVLKSAITDIPYNFSETGVVITNEGSPEHTVTLQMEELPEIAIQSVYVVNGVVNKSAKVGTAAGIETPAEAAAIVSTEWYNLHGIRIDKPSDGTIAIRRDRMSDGSVKTAKVIR